MAKLTVSRMKLGSQGLEVSAQGLGCMGMSANYGPAKPDDDMVALLRHAVAAGVTLLDTSDAYGPFTNELLLGKALQGGLATATGGAGVQVASKFGVKFMEAPPGWEFCGSPAYVRQACEASLRRLGVDCASISTTSTASTPVCPSKSRWAS